MTDIKFD